MPKCIYCLQEKKHQDFTREHVIPKALGAFKNNLTLVSRVCADCNHYFSAELELSLGRDSLEAIFRHKFRVVPPERFVSHKGSRTQIRLSGEDFFKGSIMELTYDPVVGVGISPVDQAGFQKLGTDEWVFFALSEIQSREDLENRGFIVKEGRVKILGNKPEKIEQDLIDKGFKPNRDDSEVIPFDHYGETLQVEVNATVDSIILRSVAKIAFNYLAKVTEQYGAHFLLATDFGGVRGFIRHAIGPDSSHFIIPSQDTPILYDERRSGQKYTHGHLITVYWDGSIQGYRSEVSLFNEVTYHVNLCRRYRGICVPIRCGHHFDVEAMTVRPLHGPPGRWRL